MGQLKYYFKKRTANSPTETAIKNSFQKLYQANDYAIFETFWQNEGLRGTLFPRREFPDDGGNALNDFKGLVTDQLSILFDFIEIQ